jgi:hypothetical protein
MNIRDHSLSLDNITIAEATPKGMARFDAAFFLVIFMRILALFWMAKGLYSWAYILGAVESDVSFEASPASKMSATLYFAVMDILAAVGLWLASGWGGVLWILALTSQIVILFLLPSTHLPLFWAVLGYSALGIFYLSLSWFAAQQE